MGSIIIGGGKIGYYLLKTLRSKNYQAVLVERKHDICLKIANELDADVICGDGTDPDVLRDAGIGEAEIVAAVTGTDEENLVICQIAKVNFHIEKVIARVNNPKNIAMFRELGIDRTVCSTEVIANIIDYELNRGDCRIVQPLENGAMILAEMSVTPTNGWRGKAIRELKLPEKCVIVSVLHAGEILYPRGDTKIEENDKVLFITSHRAFEELSASKTAGDGI